MRPFIKFCLNVFIGISACFLLSQNVVYSQKTLSGYVLDTFNFSDLEFTSISLIQQRDSLLIATNRCNSEGYFSMYNFDTHGDYFIIISNPGFIEYIDTISIKREQVSLGKFYLTPIRYLLEEVNISSKLPIIRRGDTIEYVADSFTTDKFENVQDLIRRLPGLTVDGKGKIMAHGQQVSKMLVDGDEFFSDDPAVVSQMLKSSMIETVQVYDLKSDKVKLTGIDDGKRSKAINLVLKESSKKGFFGDVQAGGGVDKVYNGQSTLNIFRPSRKIGLYGNLSNFKVLQPNTPTQHINTSDLSNTQQGIPKSRNVGLHFDKKFDSLNPLSVSLNYKLNNDNTYNKSTIETLSILPSENTNREDKVTSDLTQYTHSGSLKVEKRIGASSLIR